MHIAIIGAGAAGLVAARHATDPLINFTCEIFEQTSELGGTWIYTDNTGLDEYGISIRTSMYNGLITNLPKEIMNYPDFLFPNYEDSYITQQQVLKYLHDYAKHYNLVQHIKFRHLVEEIRPIADEKWKLLIRNVINNTKYEQIFDAVVVCVGHSTKPNMPIVPEMDKFLGKQLHSHSYRKAEVFVNHTVLVIGGGPSAVDITFQLLHYGIQVILSSRKIDLNVTFPDKVIMKPKTVRFEENKAIFEDQTSMIIDVIIYCTGYLYDFPFLTKECNITVDDNFVQPLYKHIINIEKPSMAFIGIQGISLTFPLFHYQAQMYLKYLKGLIKLPPKIDMQLDTESDMAARWAKGYPKSKAHVFGFDFQKPYFDSLAKLANTEPLSPVIFKIFKDVFVERKLNSIYEIIDNDTFIKK